MKAQLYRDPLLKPGRIILAKECFLDSVCTTPPTPPGGMAVNCVDSDSNGENVPSPMDVCTLTCISGQTPTVATTTCQSNGMFDNTLECPAGKYIEMSSRSIVCLLK